MEPTTLQDLAKLDAALVELADLQEKTDKLLVRIADSGDRGSKAELCRRLNIKPQSLADRITAARNRLTQRKAG